ncbi:MAG: helix-turn-helix domain-containing protein [Acidimicrobiia bacterium]
MDVSPVTGARRRAGRDDAGAGAAGARARILDAAVRLVSERGAAATSMRQLAAACDLNVATIYHYFPSKADLLRAIIEERRYGERMASEDPPMRAELAPHERFEELMAWLVEQALDERTTLRLLVAEGLHGNDTARGTARALVRALDGAIEAWLEAGFPERGPATPPPVAARIVRRALLSAVLEQLVTGAPIGDELGRDLAAALLGPR